MPRPRKRLDPMRIAALRRPSRAPGRARGQSLVEFALVLMPLLLILLGIIQFGFIFNAQVTITNAAREGARTATVYVYHSNLANKTENDKARNDAALASVTASLGILSTSAPQFSTTSGSWTATGSAPNLTYTSGDVVVAYSLPAGVQDSDSRCGEQIKVTITYHQDLIIPLIANLLPQDANHRLAQSATVTMVIN
jgi:Flp pilus assembly protein TadG